MRFFYLFVISLTLFACKSRKAACEKDMSSFYISVETTPCFGRCPMYMIQITGIGKANLENRRFIDRLGNFESTLGTEDVQYLMKTANELDWDTLQPEYLTGYTDLPSTIIRRSIKAGDTSEVRFEYGAAPEQLERLALKADSLRTGLEWTPVNQDI